MNDSRDVSVAGVVLQPRAPNAPKDLTCHNCGKLGHKKASCPHVKGQQYLLKIVLIRPVTDDSVQKIRDKLTSLNIQFLHAFTGLHQGNEQPLKLVHVAFPSYRCFEAGSRAIAEHFHPSIDVMVRAQDIAKRNLCQFCGGTHKFIECPSQLAWRRDQPLRSFAHVAEQDQQPWGQPDSYQRIVSFSQAQQLGLCWEWCDQGHCKKFEAHQCKYKHPERYRGGRWLCRFDFQSGGCRKGDDCQYFHKTHLVAMRQQHPASDAPRQLLRAPASAAPRPQASSSSSSSQLPSAPLSTAPYGLEVLDQGSPQSQLQIEVKQDAATAKPAPASELASSTPAASDSAAPIGSNPPGKPSESKRSDNGQALALTAAVTDEQSINFHSESEASDSSAAKANPTSKPSLPSVESQQSIELPDSQLAEIAASTERTSSMTSSDERPFEKPGGERAEKRKHRKHSKSPSKSESDQATAPEPPIRTSSLSSLSMKSLPPRAGVQTRSRSKPRTAKPDDSVA